MLTKIISGGQTGEVAAWRAARSFWLLTGGYMPKGFKTLAGPKPEYQELYGAIETQSAKYPDRTEKNVIAGDVTFFLYEHSTPSLGQALTKRLAKKHNKPFIEASWRNAWATIDGERGDEYFARLIVESGAENLNVAMNRDIDEEAVEEWLTFVFRRVLELQESK